MGGGDIERRIGEERRERWERWFSKRF